MCELAPDEPTKIQSASLCPHCVEPLVNHLTFVDKSGDVEWNRIVNEIPTNLVTAEQYFDELQALHEDWINSLDDDEIEGLQFGT